MAAEQPTTPSELKEEQKVSGGVARVKAEYLVAAPPPHTHDQPAAAAESGAKESKTRFKKRPRDEEPSLTDRMCSGSLTGLGCPFGEKCRYSHDLAAFMAQREPDLGERCVNFDLFGWCRYGALCRFGSGHIDPASGANLKRNAERGGVLEEPPPLNALPKEVQIQLRKNNFPFETQRAGGGSKRSDKRPAKQQSAAAADSAPLSSEASGSTTSPAGATPASSSSSTSSSSSMTSLDAFPSRPVKLVDFSNKVYIAPLTTVGNLPFRRIMKSMGADITCGEMAMCANLCSGQSSEWALLRRHPSEDVFGVQIAAAHADQFERCAELLEKFADVDFVDVNMGCPIDLVVDKGAGSALMNRPPKFKGLVHALTKRLSCPITLKMRIGWNENKPNAHHVIHSVEALNTGRISAFMIHGRSRLQRYSKLADWNYINSVASGTAAAEVPPPSIPVIGNGDIYSWEEWEEHKALGNSLSTCCMLARGALIKPWLPTEIKESRHWDISASERLDMLKQFVAFGLEHWGSDQKGVNNVRRFLLEWLSFLHRYVPVGLLEVLPSRLNDRAPPFSGRSELETLMASRNSEDWVKISELLLGPVPSGFKFLPKHKANAHSASSSSSSGAEAEG